MNDYRKLLEENRQRAAAERQAANSAEESRKKEFATALAAVWQRMEVHAKPEFLKARAALVSEGIPAEIDMGERIGNPLESTIIRLSISVNGQDYRAELQGSVRHGISAHLYAPGSTSNLGTCDDSGDLRDHAAALLARFVSTIPA